jgi:hypothetical protein
LNGLASLADRRDEAFVEEDTTMTNVQFTVHGPFEIPADKGRKAHDLLLDDFWEEGNQEALRERCGCYVFALRRKKGSIVPHYVGLTKRRFDREVFNRSNLRKYRGAVSNGSGKPVLFLVVPRHGKGKVSRKYIGELETFLIQAASVVNPDVSNVKGVPRPKWSIYGVTGRRPGKPPEAAEKLRKALGITA